MKTSNRFCPSGLCLLVLVMLSAGLMRAETTLDAALNVGGGELEFSSYSTEDTNYPWTVLTEPGESHDGQSAARSCHEVLLLLFIQHLLRHLLPQLFEHELDRAGYAELLGQGFRLGEFEFVG